jgi:predicted nucleotide-binding protein
MLEQFSGQTGRRRLVEVLANQELVLQNRTIAQHLAKAARLKEYKTQQKVYIEGRPGNNELYLVLSGTFDLLVRNKCVREVRPGQALGEFPILNPSLRYTVTIRAREPSLLATVRERQFLSIASQCPDIWKNMAKMLVARLHATNELVPLPKKPCVFIGHGHGALWARVQLFLQNDCRLPVIAFESKPHAGELIEDILEDMLQQATFAVLVLTGDDQTAKGGKRARQNVVHEAGLFQGVLGFKRAIMLVQKGLEEFSNVHGLQHISFKGAAIESTFFELQRVLQREKLIS